MVFGFTRQKGLKNDVIALYFTYIKIGKFWKIETKMKNEIKKPPSDEKDSPARGNVNTVDKRVA